MDRKPVFDVVRRLLGGRLDQSQVEAIDAAITLGLGWRPTAKKLGALSERYECGGRGPGTVSSGKNDPGGVSYGLFQLSSRAGTCAAFVASEGKRWQGRFGTAAPGSEPFSTAWREIAKEEPAAFAEAQRRFIARAHYWPVVSAVREQTGLDLDSRHHAVRDAAWSTAVQHGRAARILAQAVRVADQLGPRTDPGYDRALLEAIYEARSAYVLRVAARSGIAPGERNLLKSLVSNRFVTERADALAMLESVHIKETDRRGEPPAPVFPLDGNRQ